MCNVAPTTTTTTHTTRVDSQQAERQVTAAAVTVNQILVKERPAKVNADELALGGIELRQQSQSQKQKLFLKP